MPPESEVIALPGRPARTPKPQFLSALAERTLRARLERITDGELLIEHEGSMARYGRPGAERPVSLRIHDRRFWTEVAFGGSIGAGESYMQGDWRTDDLTGLVRLMLRNRDVLDGVDGSLSRITAPVQKLLHLASRNTRSGSRRNIAAHYDLGNDFFALFLDPTMMYSSARFEHDAMTLEEASLAKLDRICRRLDLRPGQRVLEIGTGWGGFALHAARHYGCHVTTTTLSREQHELAAERIARAGLSERITLLLEDYRDLALPSAGGYDRLVSIEMIEAVGREYWPTYFETIHRLLRAGGKACIQSIVIDDSLYGRYIRSTDFIQQYIFPGGCLPCPSEFRRAAQEAGLRVSDELAFGQDYAETLRRWRATFLSRRTDVLQLGFDERFIRIWEFYLAYCEAAFDMANIDLVQYTLVRRAA